MATKDKKASTQPANLEEQLKAEINEANAQPKEEPKADAPAPVVERTKEEILAERNRKISEAQRGKPRKNIAVYANGKPYGSICEAMKAHGIQDKGTKNWFTIRKALKNGPTEHSGVKFELPKEEK